MSDQQAWPFEDADVRALSEKLAQFTTTLAPAERAILTAIVRNSLLQGDDVEGYDAWWHLETTSAWYHYCSTALIALALSNGLNTGEHAPDLLDTMARTRPEQASSSARVDADTVKPAQVAQPSASS